MISEQHAPFWPIVWHEMKKPLSEGNLSRRVLGKIPYFQVIFGTGPGLINTAERIYRTSQTAATKPLMYIPCEWISCGYEWDPKPFQTTNSAVKLLAGSSWHTPSMCIYRGISKAVHNRTQILIIVTIALFVLCLLLLCALVHSKRTRKPFT